MWVHEDIESTGRLRIGELSRRVGVSAELLRAWERRYGLLAPTRTTGGFRLYGDADERRVRRMLAHLDSGVSAAEGARLALLERDEPPTAAPAEAQGPGAMSDRLRAALDSFDEPGAHAALDRLLAAFTLEAVLRDAVLPYLRELGERWQRGDASIAQEHFASALLRGRLLGLARGWGSGGAPKALLACLPGDQHDLGLICFGLALRNRGWQIAFLGPDTPLASITETARLLGPALVVLTATTAEQAGAAREGLRRGGPLDAARARRARGEPGARRGRRRAVPRRRPGHGGRAPRGRGGLMARPALTGWSSSERISPAGAVEFEQRVEATRPLVELSAAGALELGARYWKEVEAATHRLVRVRARGGEIELRGLGLLTLLRFGQPETVVDGSGALSRFPIVGGLLARTPAGAISFSQTNGPPVELRATIDGFFPRLAGRPGGPVWTGALYRHVQRRLHTSISHRYFRRMIGEEPQ